MDDDHKVGGTGRIKLGTESNGGFSNISISNCVFEGCQGLALETVDGALLEDIYGHQHHHARHHQLPDLICGWARGCAGRRARAIRARWWARCSGC